MPVGTRQLQEHASRRVPTVKGRLKKIHLPLSYLVAI